MEHIPVLLQETIQYLQIKPGGKYIDCTLGLGGHTKEILEASKPNGMLLGIEGDETTLNSTTLSLKSFGDRVKFVLGNFRDIEKIAKENDFEQVDGILYDLGLSSYLIEHGRGISFMKETPLDMRMRPWEQDLTAAEVVNRWPEHKITDIIYQFGGEGRSRKVARAICEYRKKNFIRTTTELAEVIESAIGKGGKIHSATKTFQALRIVVNEEYENLSKSLEGAVKLLAPHGRIVVISFHEGEDRIVKRFFKSLNKKIITKKPIEPTREEIGKNPRSRSAKLRVLENNQEGD